MEKSAAKVGPFRDKAYSVKDMADQLAYDIQQLKVEIIKHCDGEDAPSLTSVEWSVGAKRERKSTYTINDALIASKDNLDKPAEIMIVRSQGEELKKKIEAYRDHLVSLTTDLALQAAIKEALNTDAPPKKDDGTVQTWESSHFEHIPMVAVITMMSKLQSDVRNAEADIIQNLLAQIGAADTKVNKMEAIVVTKSNYVLKGNEFEARVLLAAYDSLQKPEIVLGPYRKTADGYEMTGEGRPLQYDAQGRAIYRSIGSSVGNFTLQGLLKLATPEGIVNYPFSTDYQVGEASTVISATKMNVLYIGVPNPIEISMSGVPAERVTASMTNGSIKKQGGEWIASPSSAGNVRITASATVDGRTITGFMYYRVKMLPTPIAKVGNKSGGSIAKNVLVSQQGILADMEDFLFDLRYVVTQFNMVVVTPQGERNLQSNSAAFTAEQKSVLNGLTKNQKVFFSGIKAKGPDGVKDLRDIIFTVN
jgi:gliding motility-associated protein GldM